VYAAAGNIHGDVVIWDGDTRQLLHTLAIREGVIECLHTYFAPSDTCARLVVGDSSGGLRVFHGETGALLQVMFLGRW
jgi:hypothetical protein